MLANSYWFPIISWWNPQNYNSKNTVVCSTYFTHSDTDVTFT